MSWQSEEAVSMDNKAAFRGSSYYKSLKQELQHEYRRVSHALDNYGVDMSTELEAALQRLREATGAVLEEMRQSV